MPNHTFRLNGRRVTVEAPDDLGLLYVLRDKLGITGPKYGCGVGVCRACTCHLDGREFTPCIVPIKEVAGRKVVTIEGLASGDELHPVQKAWLDLDVPQCGFCQPGQIMAASALLRRKAQPTDADIDRIENVCRCGTYYRIRTAIKQVAAEGLHVEVRPRQLFVGRRTTLHVHVTRHGEPLQGQLVRFGDLRARTDARGRAKFAVRPLRRGKRRVTVGSRSVSVEVTRPQKRK